MTETDRTGSASKAGGEAEPGPDETRATAGVSAEASVGASAAASAGDATGRPATWGDAAVDELRQRLEAFADARGWGPYHTPKNLASALSVEASELMEIFQWMTPEESATVMDEPDTAHRVEDEVADVLAYLFQLCSVLGVDPLKALSAKIERNEQRFPCRHPE